MGRSVDLDELVGSAEIARRLGVGRYQRVHDWRKRDDTFPQPVVTIDRTHVWLWPEVEKWARATGRLASGKDR